MPLPSQTHMGAVSLDVRELAVMADFYADVIGLDRLSENAGVVSLGRLGYPLVILRENRELPLRPFGSAGLFHTAILFSSAEYLAAALARVARYAGHLYTGSADHHVSLAFYLDDPEGNGIELYIDRPRAQWVWKNNRIQMTREYIDPNAFIRRHHRPDVELGTNPVHPDATSIGHVHLQVGSIPQARDFYVHTLGFTETTAYGDEALFISAGGYHHHMAMNVWGSRGAGPRVPSLGLGRADIILPDQDSIAATRERLTSAGITVRDDGAQLTFYDPWKNEISLVSHANPGRE